MNMGKSKKNQKTKPSKQRKSIAEILREELVKQPKKEE